MPSHIEFALPFLLERCGVTVPLAERRLNALENTMALLARRWREAQPITPASELRMSPATLRDYLTWVLDREPARASLAARLNPYGKVADVSVPEGWVRLRL